MAKRDSSNVNIGKISGNIQGSIIAGRDVSKTDITIGDHKVNADKDPTVDELKELIGEIQKDLSFLISEQEILKAVFTRAPEFTRDAEQNLKQVAKLVDTNTKPVEAKSVYEKLINSIKLLTPILDGADTLTTKAIQVGQKVLPAFEVLKMSIEKITVAALWVAKLWFPVK